MKKILLFVLLLFISSCNKENPVENPAGNNTYGPAAQDTLRREIIKDVFLFADSLKDVYTLDENVYAKVHLKNEKNSAGLPIFIGSYPPFLAWSLWNPDNDLISGGPLTIGFSEYDDTLKTGHELAEDFKWDQIINSPNEMASGLKAFAGDYNLFIAFRGISDKYSPYLIKYFKISEDGDPLSYCLTRDYGSKDTLKVSLLLRNRISKPITLTSSADSSEILIVTYNSNQRSDAVFVQKFVPGKSVYNLAPKSDNVMLEYKRPLADFTSRGIKGAFNLIVNLYFKEKTISSQRVVFF